MKADVESRVQRAFKHGLLRPILLWVLPALVLGVGFWFYKSLERYAGTDNAYVRAEHSYISAEINGNITRVAVHDNQRVEKGQLLLELDTDMPRNAVELAEAKLAAVQTDIEALKKQYRTMQAGLVVAAEQTRFASAEFERQKSLASRKLGSQSALDKAQQMFELLRGGELILQEQMKGTLVRLAGDPDLPVDNHPEVREARAELERARIQLKRAHIHSPRDGIVSRVPFIGEYMAAGVPRMVVLSESNMWIQANFKETDLDYMRPGQKVEIEIDAYPHHTWYGHVHRIAPATGAEYSLLPPQNASGNWVKVVQRVPVRIDFDALDAKAPPLRIGMSANVRVDLGEHRSTEWSEAERRGPP
jgi:membrane fusion protein, multidrug efflux system